MIFEQLKNKQATLSVIGLGYVGLPIALEFAHKFKVIGFDINPKRVELMQKKIDPSKELSSAAFENADTETPATDSAGENADTETPATDITKENEATEAPATDSDEATDMTETITHSVTGETDDSGTKCHLGIKPINVFDLQRTLFSRPIIMRSEICLFPE